jgi:hypothetical protein
LDKEFEMPPDTSNPDERSDWSQEQHDNYAKERKEAVDKARIIPEKLTSTSNSPLVVEVTSGSGGTLTVDVGEYMKK